MMNSVSPDELNMYQQQPRNGTSNNSQQNQPSSQPLQYNNTTVHHQQQTSTAATHSQHTQQPVYNNTQSQQQQPVYNNTSMSNRSMSNSGTSSISSSGGPLYNNLIPGHYRYGVKPPEPPPGPLSYSNTFISRAQSNSYNGRQQHYSEQQSVDNSNRYYHNISTQQQQNNHQSNNNEFDKIQVLEPDDDDYIGIDSSSIDNINIEDDEQYYRPFRHTSTTVSSGGVGVSMSSVSTSNSKKTTKKKKKSKQQPQQQLQEEERPVDLLAVLLNDCTQVNAQQGEDSIDIASLISEASTKSQRARELTNSLAAKQYQSGDDYTAAADKSKETKKEDGEDDNDLYAITSNAHTDAAMAFQRVYRILLGLDDISSSSSSSSSVPALSTTRRIQNKPLSQSEEIAKSMILLSNIHVRMSKSLINMGMKWNMGKFDSKTGRMIITKKSDDGMSCTEVSGKNVGKNVDGKKSTVSSDGKKGKDASKTSAKDDSSSDTSTATSSTPTEAQHERLRMAVRGALDTTNHEEDLTNSTFLARSTMSNNNKTSSKKQSVTKSKNKLLASTARASGNIMNRVMDPKKKKQSNIDPNNPVDDLMKLEKELQCMDMQLEMGNSVANLNNGGGVRPDGSFMVVPTGSGASFMSSSSMWTSGILTTGGGQQKPPSNGRANPRSRANHLQSFQGNKQAPSSSQRPQIPAAGLDQSWWGGGQASILASSAVATAASNTSTQQPPHSSESTNGTSDASSSTNQASSTNTKQLMQLMDSLNRLGNENAQLMREVEDAKAARAEAKAAKEMMSKFKNEYSSRFNKVKEALTKYPQNNNAGSGDNPVVNRAYMKSASMLEIQKRDQMIKKLSADLKKERDDAKKRDSSLQKYEAFYREVKARSAEKARQRQQALEQQQKKQQQQLQQKRS